MSEHRLNEAGVRKALRATSTRSLMLFVIMEGFALYVGVSRLASLAFMILPMVLLGVMLGAAFYRGRKRVIAQLTSYVVTLDDDRIRRDLTGMPSVEVARADVSAIEERHPGGLAVYGRDRRNLVGVSDEIEGYDTIRERLAAWHAIEEKAPSKGLAPIAAIVLTVAAFGVTVLSQNRIIVVAVGSALTVALLICGGMVYRSPDVDRKTRRLLFILPLPLFAIVVRVIAALLDRLPH